MDNLSPTHDSFQDHSDLTLPQTAPHSTPQNAKRPSSTNGLSSSIRPLLSPPHASTRGRMTQRRSLSITLSTAKFAPRETNMRKLAHPFPECRGYLICGPNLVLPCPTPPTCVVEGSPTVFVPDLSEYNDLRGLPGIQTPQHSKIRNYNLNTAVIPWRSCKVHRS